MMRSFVSIAIVSSLLASCNGNTMEPVSQTSPDTEVPSVFEQRKPSETQQSLPASSASDAHHHAVVAEVLQDGRYLMLLVEEAGQQSWLITRENGVRQGDHVDYHDGLVKQQYNNSTVDRTFDQVMLVSTLTVVHHGDAHQSTASSSEAVSTSNITQVQGALTPAEFLANAAQMEGQTVRVQGVVTKVNANIMKRHWIHLSEQQGGKSDVVITTQTLVPVGHAVVFEGQVVVNKDFGAGYVFDVLLENANAL